MPRITTTRRPLDPVVSEALKLRYGSFRPPTQGMFVPSQRPALPAGGRERPAARSNLLPAPAPVPLSRLLSLDMLLELRDAAARRVAAQTAPVPQPTRPAVSSPPALEGPPSLRTALRRPTLIGH
jgi:hypothetical protein